MTKVNLTSRNDLARVAIEKAVHQLVKAPAPVRLSISSADNHSSEPSLYIYIEMPSEKNIPDLASRNRLVATLLDALEQIDDSWFPYVSFGPREGDAIDEEVASGEGLDS